jgi:hypothetical protein
MRRSVVLVAALIAAAALAAAFAGSAGAYGGGATHDTWQIGLSFNCDSPTLCAGGQGGFWGWVELDRWANGSITGDIKGCRLRAHDRRRWRRSRVGGCRCLRSTHRPDERRLHRRLGQ